MKHTVIFCASGLSILTCFFYSEGKDLEGIYKLMDQFFITFFEVVSWLSPFFPLIFVGELKRKTHTRRNFLYATLKCY